MKISRPLLQTFLVASLVFAGGAACHKKGPVASGGDVGTTYDIGLEPIRFGYDKYEISSQAQSTLERHASWIKENGSVNVVIEGNTDEWGTEEYNLALGERRASAAKSYLVNLGVSPDRLSTISYGELRPEDNAHNDAAWAKNRRAEFKGRK